MFPENEQKRIVEAVRRGRYSLLLGAGFSASSTDARGETLPVGDRLRDDLADKFLGGIRNYSLAATCGAIEQPALSAYLTDRFLNCSNSEGSGLLRKFVWKAIYTFNIDDVLHSIYRRPDALQRPKFLTYRHSSYSTKDTGEVTTVHLHGSVREPDHGYIFSTSEYGLATSGDGIWFKIASDDLATQPFIILGCNHFQEPDIEHYLARRQGLLAAEAQIAPTLYVTRDSDPIKEAYCRRRGIILVKATSDEFLARLDKESGARPTPVELALPSDPNSIFAVRPNEETVRLFFRQWMLVKENELPSELSSEVGLKLLSGVEPRWSHISNNEDVLRVTTQQLLADIATWRSSGERTAELRVVAGTPGDGKSTLLLRLALESSRSGDLVFYYKSRERILEDSTLAAIRACARRPILVVEHTAEHGHQLQAILSALESEGIGAFVITSERLQRLHRVENAITYHHKQIRLAHLSLGEAQQLVVKMRDGGLLGLQSGKSNDELAKQLVGKSWFTGTTLLNRNLPSIPKVISAELSDCDAVARRIYAVVCLAHSCGYPVRMAIIERAAKASQSELTARLRTQLKGLVYGLPPAGDLRETRHRVLAESVIEALDAPARFEAFHGLASAIAPYVNRNTIRAGTDEARLAGRLLDVDNLILTHLTQESAELFFEAIKDEWSWNSRFWEQRALLKVSFDPVSALNFAQTAVGIERHPSPLTTLAKVRFRLAAADGLAPSGLVHLRDGIDQAKIAVQLTSSWRRKDIHPFDIGLRGIVEYFERLKPQRWREVPSDVVEAADEFAKNGGPLFRQQQQSGLLDRWRDVKRSI